jgi:hypothetical protein
MSKIVATDRPFLTDVDGTDAMVKDTQVLKDNVVRFATAALPEILRKCIFIATNSKNEKSVIEAAKFIKSVSDGQVSGKAIEAATKKYSNEQIAEVLSDSADSED